MDKSHKNEACWINNSLNVVSDLYNKCFWLKLHSECYQNLKQNLEYDCEILSVLHQKYVNETGRCVTKVFQPTTAKECYAIM